jgi:hypothetical protein
LYYIVLAFGQEVHELRRGWKKWKNEGLSVALQKETRSKGLGEETTVDAAGAGQNTSGQSTSAEERIRRDALYGEASANVDVAKFGHVEK